MSIAPDQVTKRYQGVPVVNDVSLSVQQGEFLVLLGPSRSGKSTWLARMRAQRRSGLEAGSGDRQLLKQLIHRLRRKIEADPAAPAMLKTEPGAGYRIDEVYVDATG